MYFFLVIQIAIWGNKKTEEKTYNLPNFELENMPVWQTHYI